MAKAVMTIVFSNAFELDPDNYPPYLASASSEDLAKYEEDRMNAGEVDILDLLSSMDASYKAIVRVLEWLRLFNLPQVHIIFFVISVIGQTFLNTDITLKKGKLKTVSVDTIANDVKKK